jgi:aromatic-L-amino-acid decarboxylase
MERVRRAFSVVPVYLETPENMAGNVREYMDYGIQLGRRFRALKMWMTLRAFGVSGVQEILRKHLALARRLRDELERIEGFVLAAPSPFSVVAFRYAPAALSPEEADAANRRILEAVNADGRSFISHTVVSGRYVLRAAIGSARTEWRHLEKLLDALRSAASADSAGRNAG